jgi:hypothetical protein
MSVKTQHRPECPIPNRMKTAYSLSGLGWISGVGSWVAAGAILDGGFPASAGAAMEPAGAASDEPGAKLSSPCLVWPTGGMTGNWLSPGFEAFLLLASLLANSVTYTLFA